MANKLKIIDTHFHIWDLEKQDLPWLARVPETIKKHSQFNNTLKTTTK